MELEAINKLDMNEYFTPSVEIIDVMSEGMFCGSPFDSANNGYGFNDLEEI